MVSTVASSRMVRVLGVAVLAAVATAVLAPLVGSSPISLHKAFAGVWPDSEVFFGVRLPRVALGLLAGGALAVAGVLFQSLLRDALATPYTLGVSSGASLGAVLAIVLGWHSVAGLPALWAAALIGAGVTLLIVVGMASEGRRMSSYTLLLAGVTLNSMAGSVILLIHNLASVGQSFAIVHWLMGSLDPVDPRTLMALSAVILPVVLLLCSQARHWNLMAVGEEWAAARGATPHRLLLGGYIAGSVLTAAITAITGPIGFVGLVVPHALRLVLGSDHRLLMPASFFWGGAFLVACDTLARSVPATELPVSVVTALIGGPVFLLLLRSRKRSLWL